MMDNHLNNAEERKRKIAIALSLLDSSSSDTSDDEILINVLKEKLLQSKKKQKSLIQSYSEDEFFNKFRMKKSICSKLITDFQKSSFYPKDISHGGTPRSSSENHVLSFLRFAGSKIAIHCVADEFSIGQSSFHMQCNRMMNYLNDIAPSIIQFPESDERKIEIATQYEKISGMPGIIGCIQSTHIPIRRPANLKKSSFCNQHQQASITLQAICDADGIFLDVFTGPSSKISNAQVFELSFIRQKLHELCSENYYLTGDESYHLSNQLMTPYIETEDDAERHYNNSLKLSRQPVVKALSQLKNRFRQLSRLDFHQVDTTAKFLISCCVLHNMCAMDKDPLPTDPADDSRRILDHSYSESTPPTIELEEDILESELSGCIQKRNDISRQLWSKFLQENK